MAYAMNSKNKFMMNPKKEVITAAIICEEKNNEFIPLRFELKEGQEHL